MFLQAKGVIRRRWKAAEAKAKELAELAVEKPDAAADTVLEQIAAAEAAELEQVKAHFALLAKARRAQIQAAVTAG